MSGYHIAAIVMLTVLSMRTAGVVLFSDGNAAAKAGAFLARATDAIAWGLIVYGLWGNA